MKKPLLMLTTLTLAAIWSVSAHAEKKQETPPAKTAIEPSAKAEKEVLESDAKKTIDSAETRPDQSSEPTTVKVRDGAANQSIPQPVSVEGMKDHPTLKKKD